jgi:hypothetical protein
MSTPTASGIDTSTVAGHNLRALLLRLLDGDPWRGEARGTARAATDRAAALGLLDIVHTCALTPLGREVAERLRPVPWRVIDASGPRMKRKRLSVWQGSTSAARCDTQFDA